MTENSPNLEQDIAALRKLAEMSSRPPILGGRILLAAGIIFGLASLVTWYARNQTSTNGAQLTSAGWIVAVVTFLVSSAIIRSRLSQRGEAATVNRATRAAWSGAGWAMLAIVAAFGAAQVQTPHASAFALLPCALFALYGCAWTVAGAMSERAWIKGVAFASFLAAVGLGGLSAGPALFLIQAICLFLLAALPGWLLIREETQGTKA